MRPDPMRTPKPASTPRASAVTGGQAWPRALVSFWRHPVYFVRGITNGVYRVVSE
jgi:hypothetical protein